MKAPSILNHSITYLGNLPTNRVPAITSYAATQNPGDGKWSAKFYWTPETKLKNTLIRTGILTPGEFPLLVAVSNSSFDAWYKSHLNATADQV